MLKIHEDCCPTPLPYPHYFIEQNMSQVAGVFADSNQNLFVGYTDYPILGPDDCIVRVRPTGVSYTIGRAILILLRYVALIVPTGRKEVSEDMKL